MACPGSVALEADYPDSSSSYAREGTVAHELAAKVLLDDWRLNDFVGESWALEENGELYRIPITQDMVDHVMDYVKLVREYAEGGTLMVEQRVPIGHLTGEEGAAGTSDAVIMRGRELVVIDLKYGMGVKVDAENNPQLQMYALGAYEQFGVLTDFDIVTMVIHQPRLNHVAECTVPLPHLLACGETVKDAAGRVYGSINSKQFPAIPWEDTYLSPGEKQCRFCKAKSTCPALKAEIVDIVHEAATLDDFADLIPVKVDSQIGDNYLSAAMSKVGLVEDWCKAIRAEVERRLLAGKSVDGFKLVEGKRGNRQWADKEAVEKLLKGFRLRNDEMYDFSLISPTKAEKLFKENPKRWVKVCEHITQSGGKPSVAPAADKRPALDVQTVAEDFGDLFKPED